MRQSRVATPATFQPLHLGPKRRRASFGLDFRYFPLLLFVGECVVKAVATYFQLLDVDIVITFVFRLYLMSENIEVDLMDKDIRV
jgi:hypothetical protein